MIELLRTALLLTGSPERAELLAAAALAAHGDSEDAYFTLYRRFLRPWRPSRRQRALQVALDHDGRSEEEVARLFGWRLAAVRQGSAAPRPRLDVIADPDISRLDGRVRALRGRRKFVRMTGAVVAFLLLAEPLYDGARRATERYSPPVAYTAPAPAPARDLTHAASEPIHSATLVEARLDEFAVDGRHWQLVGASGTRWILRDALSTAPVVVSPDGRKLAYDSDRQSGPVIHDLTTGEVTDTPYPLSTLHLRNAGFSIDGRYLAARDDNKTIVIDTRWPTVPKIFKSSRFDGWAHDGIISFEMESITVTRPDGTVERRLPYEAYEDSLISSDGRILVSPGVEELIELVDLDTGKVRQRLPVKGLNELQGWADPETVLVDTEEGLAELNLTSGVVTQREEGS